MTKSSKINVYALFDDSSADEVIFSYFGAPSSQDIPIRTFSNDIQDIDVQRSVLDGASGALASFEQHFKSSGDRYCFAYKFRKNETNQAITGQSAGLAFCLKFALKLYNDLLSDRPVFSIAATGIIEIAEEVTHIKPVDKINYKFEAALNCLESGDFFVYPQANEEQIDQKLKMELINKGITVRPIETVNQAIETIFEGKIGSDTADNTGLPKKRKWILPVSAFVIFGIFVYLLFFNRTVSCYDEVLNALELGEFSKAQTIAEQCLHDTKNDSLQHLLNQIKSELTLSSNFIYIKNDDSITQHKNDRTPLLLGAEDGYRFDIIASHPCFLYILQFDSETKAEKLYPLSPFILNQHYLDKNDSVRVPGGENMFYLDDKNHHGLITIFIIASFWRLKDMETIINKYEDSQNRQAQRNLYNELLSRINYYSDTKKLNIKSMFLQELSFIQE